MADQRISASARDQTLTRAFMIMLGTDGLRVPGLDTIGGLETHPPVPLTLSALLLLIELARGHPPTDELLQRVVSEAGGDGGQLRRFLQELTRRELLIGGIAGKDLHPQLTPIGNPVEPARIEEMLLVINVPRLYPVTSRGFEHLDDRGSVRFTFSPLEISAASEYRKPSTIAMALTAHRAACGAFSMQDRDFTVLTRRLLRAGVLRPADRSGTTASADMRRGRPKLSGERAGERGWERYQRLNQRMRESVNRSDALERDRSAVTGRRRINVVPVQHNGTTLPLALGMIIAYARTYRGGRLEDTYRFYPDWFVRPSKVRALVAEPAVFLLSNYTWSHQHNLRIAQKAKSLSPACITIHGGPNTPKYEDDCRQYFHDNPDVDIAVRGEGEVVVSELLDALAEVIGKDPLDLSILQDIRGITYRHGHEIVRTPDRDRVSDLDIIPSPYLTGLFSDYQGTELAIIETNRGCPYSCTFCDWGSAIATRIRQFSLTRVFEELDWCAQHEIAGIMCADANFGIFERDVEIAYHVAELKQKYGCPNGFSMSAAKNNTKHTRRIIEILAAAGVMTKGSIGVQSTDARTLAAVHRTNIRLDKYNELAGEFSRIGIPLWVDMMFGLPGQSPESFRQDLQGCIDRGVFPRIFMTELLVNSPMNERAYRTEHRIETIPSPDGMRKLVFATATMSSTQFREMNNLRLLFLLGDVVGMLRQIAHYVRSETGILEIDFYDGIRREIARAPNNWPTLAFSLRAIPGLLIPPGSWQLAISEAGRYARDVLGLAADGSLDTVLAVQLAVLPAPDRILPETLELKHDYGAWHRAMTAATREGYHGDWHRRIPKLREFGPAEFTIDDPYHLCSHGIGAAVDGDMFGNYELRSPAARWMPAGL